MHTVWPMINTNLVEATDAELSTLELANYHTTCSEKIWYSRSYRYIHNNIFLLLLLGFRCRTLRVHKFQTRARTNDRAGKKQLSLPIEVNGKSTA